MLFLKLFLLISLFSTPIPEKWKRIDTDQGINFLFPNTAQRFKKITNNIPSTVYQTKDIVCVFGVVCSDFSSNPTLLSGPNTQILYEELRQGSISMETANLKSERTVPYDNILIKEIEYTVVKDMYEMTYFKRFIFRDKYVYQISIGGRSRHRNLIEEERDIFFNSIAFAEIQPDTFKK